MTSYIAPDGSEMPREAFELVVLSLSSGVSLPVKLRGDDLVINYDWFSNAALKPPQGLTVSEAVRASAYFIMQDDGPAATGRPGPGMGSADETDVAATWISAARTTVMPTILNMIQGVLRMREETGGSEGDRSLLAPMLVQTLATDLLVQACLWGGTYQVSTDTDATQLKDMKPSDLERCAMEYLNEMEGLVYRQVAHLIKKNAADVLRRSQGAGSDGMFQGFDQPSPN